MSQTQYTAEILFYETSFYDSMTQSTLLTLIHMMNVHLEKIKTQTLSDER